MEMNEPLVEYIAQTYYNMNPFLGSIRKLYGYSDKNYSFIDSNDHQCYVLKLVNPDESHRDLAELIDETLDEVDKYLGEKIDNCLVTVAKLIATTANRRTGFITLRREMANNEPQFLECNFKLFQFYDGLTVFEFIRQNKDLKHRSKFYARLGMACNQISRPLGGLNHYLVARLRELRQKYSFPWDMMTCGDHIAKNLDAIYPADSQDPIAKARGRLVDKTLKEFAIIKTKLIRLPQYILHGDLGLRNILLHRESLANYAKGNYYREKKQDICFIDFQDIQVGAQIVDVSITLLYLIIEQDQMSFELALVDLCKWFLKGYQAASCHQLDPMHLYLAPTLMKIRLCQSLVNGLIAYKEDCTNTDVMQTNQRGWQLLELMCTDYTVAGLHGPLQECNSFKMACRWLDHPPNGLCKCLDDLQTLFSSNC